jgi:hypothetical protein
MERKWLEPNGFEKVEYDSIPFVPILIMALQKL